MTIERFSFKPPIHIDGLNPPTIVGLMLFVKKMEIPPNSTLDVTPDTSEDTYVLRTMPSVGKNYEDTVGELKTTFKYTSATQTTQINERSPLALVAVADPQGIQNGLVVSEIIRYVPSAEAKHALKKQATSIYDRYGMPKISDIPSPQDPDPGKMPF